MMPSIESSHTSYPRRNLKQAVHQQQLYWGGQSFVLSPLSQHKVICHQRSFSQTFKRTEPGLYRQLSLHRAVRTRRTYFKLLGANPAGFQRWLLLCFSQMCRRLCPAMNRHIDRIECQINRHPSCGRTTFCITEPFLCSSTNPTHKIK